MNEVWKDIPEYEGHYMASNIGRVKSLKNNKELILKIGLGGSGKRKYPYLWLWKNNIRKGYFLHHIILFTFGGKKPNGMVCRHLDDNQFNNNIENLCYGTQKENVRDAINNEVFPRGERASKSKITGEDVVEIRRMYKTKKYYQWQIAEKYKLDKSSISDIVRGESWGHIREGLYKAKGK